MKTTTPVLLVLAAALAACASKPKMAPGQADWAANRPLTTLIEGPVVRPPANDISETQRREWFDAQRPRVEEVPSQPVAWRDWEPYHVVPESDPWWLWAIPLSLSFGYSSGGHHHDDSWGVGGTWGGWR